MTWVKSISTLHSHSHSDWFRDGQVHKGPKNSVNSKIFIWKYERNVPGPSLSLSLSLEITERAALVSLRTCRFHYKVRL